MEKKKKKKEKSISYNKEVREEIKIAFVDEYFYLYRRNLF